VVTRKSDSLWKRIYKARTAYLYLLPLFGGLIVFNYFPPISGLYRSLYQWDATNVPVFLGLSNFRELFNDTIFLNSLPVMLKIMLPRLFISIIVPFIVAEMIFAVKSSNARYVYRVMILLPIVAPGVVTMLVWRYLYDPHMGLITEIFRFVGLIGPNEIVSWLSDPNTVIPSIIFMGFPWISGTNVLIYMSGLIAISSEIIESSKLDGANIMQRIFFIDIPMLLGQIKFFLVFGIINGLQDFGIQIVLTRGGPGYSTYVPGYYMYVQAFFFGRMGYASAIGTTMFAIILTLTIINYRFFKTDTSK
jgi:ABC-type sugar transport system permease subunit